MKRKLISSVITLTSIAVLAACGSSQTKETAKSSAKETTKVSTKKQRKQQQRHQRQLLQRRLLVHLRIRGKKVKPLLVFLEKIMQILITWNLPSTVRFIS